MTEDNRPLKYMGYSIVFQEVPNEVSLAFNISGCPYDCMGCHSGYLKKYDGNFLMDDLEELIEHYHLFISCVCFFGGDQNMNELTIALKIAKKYGLKTCLYTGCDSLEKFKDILPVLNYLKIGGYKHELGGLRSKKTNQIMFKIKKGGKVLENITHFFQEDKNEI